MRTGELDYSDENGKRYVGYLAAPDDPTGAAILLAHNAPGVDTFERQTAHRLADRGYVVLCADYVGDGKVLALADVPRRFAAAMADTTVLRPAITAGLRALVAQAGVDARRVAAIGYCFGGTAALELARGGADVAAAVAIHATLPITHPRDNHEIRGKVLVQVGAADAMVPQAMRATFETQMNDAGVDWRMILYGGVQHAFTVPDAGSFGMPGLRYDQKADERSWRAMLDLFAESIDLPSP